MDRQTVAENLRRIRKQKKYSQKVIAEKAKISTVAYSNIETGKSFPKDETLRDLAIALGVSTEDIWRRRDSLDNVRFRASHRMITRDRVLMDVENWLRNRTKIEEILNKEDKNTSFNTILSNVEALRKNGCEGAFLAVEAAKVVRSELKLEDDPIRSIVSLFEINGIKVFPYEIQSDHFFGLSVGPNGGGPAIVVNVWNSISVERWIFSAAHELGHLILHQGAYDSSEKEESPGEEKEADLFASHFLMPNGAFIKSWNRLVGSGLVPRLMSLKKQFKVSWKTVVYRLSDLTGKSDWWKQAYMDFKRSRIDVRKHREPMPLDSIEFFGNEEPNWFFEAQVFEGYEKGLISDEEVGELLNLRQLQLDKLLDRWNSRLEFLDELQL